MRLRCGGLRPLALLRGLREGGGRVVRLAHHVLVHLWFLDHFVGQYDGLLHRLAVSVAVLAAEDRGGHLLDEHLLPVRVLHDEAALRHGFTVWM